MPIQKLLALLDTHKSEVTLTAARKVLALNLKGYSQSQLAETQMAARFLDPLALVSHYIQSGQIKEWTDYIATATVLWLSNGWPSEEISRLPNV